MAKDQRFARLDDFRADVERALPQNHGRNAPMDKPQQGRARQKIQLLATESTDERTAQ